MIAGLPRALFTSTPEPAPDGPWRRSSPPPTGPWTINSAGQWPSMARPPWWAPDMTMTAAPTPGRRTYIFAAAPSGPGRPSSRPRQGRPLTCSAARWPSRVTARWLAPMATAARARTPARPTSSPAPAPPGPSSRSSPPLTGSRRTRWAPRWRWTKVWPWRAPPRTTTGALIPAPPSSSPARARPGSRPPSSPHRTEAVQTTSASAWP